MSYERLMAELGELSVEEDERDRPTAGAMAIALYAIETIHAGDRPALLNHGTVSGMEGWITGYWINNRRHIHVTFRADGNRPPRIFYREETWFGGCEIDVLDLRAWLVWYHGGACPVERHTEDTYEGLSTEARAVL